MVESPLKESNMSPLFKFQNGKSIALLHVKTVKDTTKWGKASAHLLKNMNRDHPLFVPPKKSMRNKSANPSLESFFFFFSKDKYVLTDPEMQRWETLTKNEHFFPCY